MQNSRLVIAVTGASGSPYADALLIRALQAGISCYVVFSPTAEKVIRTEIPKSLIATLTRSNRRARFEEDEELTTHGKTLNLLPSNFCALRTFAHDDLYAPIASGSLGATHMAVVPASMGTVARIAAGMSGNLIERCADVMLKERRPLVVVPRETPLSLIHLQNLTNLLQAGSRIVPAMPGFYHQPRTVEDLVDFLVERVCEQLGIDALVAQNRLHWNANRL
jgi:4-hydroxy-3-polyprenylbenzoate decarboxylase